MIYIPFYCFMLINLQQHFINSSHCNVELLEVDEKIFDRANSRSIDDQYERSYWWFYSQVSVWKVLFFQEIFNFHKVIKQFRCYLQTLAQILLYVWYGAIEEKRGGHRRALVLKTQYWADPLVILITNYQQNLSAKIFL